MFHFIPSWYNENRTWYDNNYLWYFKPTNVGFDDTINQMKMFDYAGKESRLVVLNYMPNLRYYLHRYDLLESGYYSVFDDIQEIGNVRQQMIDFRQLNWPEGVDFTYTPFIVLVKKSGDLIAKVQFGEEGNLTHIDYFANEQIAKKYLFDDRGFLSSILYYDNGGEAYQDYLASSGERIMREYLREGDHHVEINPKKAIHFLKLSYSDIEELIREKYLTYLHKEVSKSDTIIASFNQVHNAFIVGNTSKGN
ncbi:TPA: accessory Sec system protein Asp1, partial [Streptococcus agalactiae]|nr:accessory Sec system protein Asp1 [Streptococcus agalactiae]